jgi:hypothetical protein
VYEILSQVQNFIQGENLHIREKLTMYSLPWLIGLVAPSPLAELWVVRSNPATVKGGSFFLRILFTLSAEMSQFEQVSQQLR